MSGALGSGGAPRVPRVGDEIGPYLVEHVVGVGGMGMVFGARDRRLDRQVALKVVVGYGAQAPEFVQRFQREAAVLARLDHPHVIAIYDHGEHEGTPFIVTQFAAGGDLGRLLGDHGSLPRGHAVRVARQVAEALDAAHRVGVVHRDVKPANVLLRDDRPDRLHAYLCDFGVALTDSGGLTAAGAVAGTWNYLAPERIAGAPGSPASDIYAVGCLLYECLTGATPYTGSDVEVAMQHQQSPVPQLDGADEATLRLNEILRASLAKDPAARFPTAHNLANALRQVEQVVSTSTSHAAAGGRRRRRGLLITAGVATLAVVGGGLTAWAVTRDGDEPGNDPAPVPAASELVAGDVDGDGLGDVLAVARDREGQLLLSSGADGLTTPAEEWTTWTGDVLLGNIDGDDVPDVLAVPQISSVGAPVTTYQVTVLQGPTDVPAVTVSTGVELFLEQRRFLADVDGDGLDDLVVAEEVQHQAEDYQQHVYAGISRGDGTFEPLEEWVVLDRMANDLVLGDFDGDGALDLATTLERADQDDWNTLNVPAAQLYLGGSAEPAGGGRLAGGVSSTKLAGDVDGDGRDEIVVVGDDGGRVAVAGWDDGELSEPDYWYAGDTALPVPAPATLTDVDGDGLLDLAVVTADGSVSVLRSTGSSFEPLEATQVVDPAASPNLDDLYTILLVGDAVG